MTRPGGNLRTKMLDYRQCHLLTADGSFDSSAFNRLTVWIFLLSIKVDSNLRATTTMFTGLLVLELSVNIGTIAVIAL